MSINYVSANDVNETDLNCNSLEGDCDNVVLNSLETDLQNDEVISIENSNGVCPIIDFLI